MTAIAATLTTSNVSQAIQLTLQRLQQHDLTPMEAEKDLLLLFDAELGAALKPELTKYISDIAEQVRSGALEPEDAASDVQEMIGFWLSRSDNLHNLLDLGTD